MVGVQGRSYEQGMGSVFEQNTFYMCLEFSNSNDGEKKFQWHATQKWGKNFPNNMDA